MPNRYEDTKKILNNSQAYKEIFESKKIQNITQYSSFNFGNLKYIEDANVAKMVHTVKAGEKLYTISQNYYNSPDYGWLICYTNKISNETLIQPGLDIYIYFPLENILRIMQYGR